LLYQNKNFNKFYEFEKEGGTVYRYFQELKNSKFFKNKLEQFDILALINDYSKFENSRQFILAGENYNINRLIENTKKFFVEENIPNLLNYHFENFDKINKIFIETLKIQLMPTMQEEIENKTFQDEMSNIIHDSYLSFPTDGIYNIFGSKNQGLYGQNEKNFNLNKGFFGDYKRNYSQSENEIYNRRGDINDNYNFNIDGKQDRNKIKFSFFYGDNRKIKILIQIIDSKLFMLMKNRLQQTGQAGSSIKTGIESINLFPILTSFEILKSNFIISS